MGVLSIPYINCFIIKGNRMRTVVIILLVFFASGCYAQGDCLRFVYSAQVGVKERGNNRGKEVEAYQRAAGVKPGNPWCASFVYWCHKQCNPGLELKAGAQANSWFPSNKIVYLRNKKTNRAPRAGDVIGIYSASSKRIGHVGFYDSETKDFIVTVEGNVRSKGTGGVWRMKRIKRTVYAIARWTDN
jgi:hypothetical protein